MGDSTCVMQSFSLSSEHCQQQGGSVRALGESVSFGKFMTETLQWEKFSTFNQNRYLEEAQRFSKPGSVAQKKAFFEAHFKKIAADKTPNLVKAANSDTKNKVPVKNFKVGNENLGEPCMDTGSEKSKCGFSITTALSSAHDSSSLNRAHAGSLMESQSREAYYHDKISELGTLNNSHPAILLRTDVPGSDIASDASQKVEVCDQMDSLHDTSNIKHVGVELESFQKIDPPDGLKTVLDQSEVEDNSSIPMDVCQDKMVIQNIQERIAQFAMASTGDNQPAFISSNALTYRGKPIVQSHSKLKPSSLSTKEINSTKNMKAFENKENNSCLPVSKSSLIPKKLDSSKYPANFVTIRGSKEHSNQVYTTLECQKKEATFSNTITIRNSAAELYLRPAPTQLKDMTITQIDRASMRNSVDIRKSAPKWLHMSVSFGSHVREKQTPASLQMKHLQRTGFKACSTHEPANQVLSDTTNMGTQAIPSSHTSAFDRKSTKQFHAKHRPPLHRSGSRVTQSSSALTLSHTNVKKSLPKSLHMSVDLSSTVEGVTQKSRSSGTTTPAGRVPRESCNPVRKLLNFGNWNHEIGSKFVTPDRLYFHLYDENTDTTEFIEPDLIVQSKASLQKSMQSSAGLHFDDKRSKRPEERLEGTSNGIKTTEKWPSCRPGPAVNLIKPPYPTVFIPFKFRSDERAAKRKEKLEEKIVAGAENPLQRKEKLQRLPSRRPPLYSRKASPGKAVINNKLETSSNPSKQHRKVKQVRLPKTKTRGLPHGLLYLP